MNRESPAQKMLRLPILSRSSPAAGRISKAEMVNSPVIRPTRESWPPMLLTKIGSVGSNI